METEEQALDTELPKNYAKRSRMPQGNRQIRTNSVDHVVG